MPNGRLISNVTRLQETYLGLLDLASGDTAFRPYNDPLRHYALNPTGKWVAYLNQGRAGGELLQRLEVLNHSDDSEAVPLIEFKGDYALWPPVWSMHLDDTKIAVMGGPVIPGQSQPAPKWLLLADPNYPTGLYPLAEAKEGEALAYPVFCADNSVNTSLIYRVSSDNEYRLIHHRLGAPPETLQ